MVQLFKGIFKFELKTVFGGIALGIPNYFSVYFLVRALRSDLWDSSGIFTVNNVGVVFDINPNWYYYFQRETRN